MTNVPPPPPKPNQPAQQAYQQQNQSFLYLKPYYQEEFNRIQQSNEAYKGKWNWAAFFFGIIWALSKGLILSAIVCIVTTGFTAGIAAFFWIFYYPLRGNYMYYKKVAKHQNPVI
ncbi:MAG: DUF2628 domain-containing protein [Leptospiraceae bacterium]|nr:DUF2628 domain-containing protein [Leptospiraceae bacterium]